MRKLLKNQMIIPLAALFFLLIFNLIADPPFFEIRLEYNNDGYRVLLGNLINVIDNGSELAILAIGMTLVTAATGGQDISVGAAVAIGGSTIVRIVRGGQSAVTELQHSVLLAFIVACLVTMLFGAFNGALVAFFKIQPMVATLILFTAGRSIARWINLGDNTNIADPVFKYFGLNIPGCPIPTPILIVVIVAVLFALIMKFTTLKLYIQSVGINENSSRLNGINPVFIKFITFVILGFCVAVVSLIKVSRIGNIFYDSTAKDIEMDAILAVALGGNALSGGKFNIWASVVGAYVIQLLLTTLYKFQVKSDALPAYKAVVIIILVVMSAPSVREKLAAWTKSLKSKSGNKEVA